MPYVSTPWIGDLGPCQVLYGTTVLAKTHGGVKVKLADSSKKLTYDQTGETPADEILTGREITAAVPLGLPTIEELAACIPGSVLGEGTLTKSLTIKAASGQSLAALAQALILKPIIDGAVTDDETLWLKFPKATVKANFDYAYDSENQRVYMAEFTGMVDDDGSIAVFGKDTNAQA